MKIFGIFERPQLINSVSPQDCPNCWGYSEWANNKLKASYKLNKVSLKEVYRRDGFIRKFMNKHLR